MILDDPTRGIDVGTKSEIYNLINEIAVLAQQSQHFSVANAHGNIVQRLNARKNLCDSLCIQ
jgi:ABC-type sugar transport system ATPase subunit